ncbi:DMT family protein [Wielerella bovis]|uniref:DMT family protein n=1 Tax=Wielerella bovis TaxID=2917790 RepID=UPI0020187A63|nr:DMT family protein [Wielerella bovis]MCG7656618.1 DMT family protein [Wielerella bovis]MCG7658843.1 DMT family protein [Wielerella bovis]
MHYLIIISLLTVSNLLMTIAWYWHIKPSATPFPLWQIVLISWSIALLEYYLVIPANHFGTLWGIKPFQLKILQEIIALSVFTLFAILYLNEKITLNYLLSFVCILGAVYFAFRK